MLVTGAVAGIGRSAAEKFVAEGARVIAVDRSAERLDDLAERSDRVTAVELDITDRAGIKALAERIGRLDVLFG